MPDNEAKNVDSTRKSRAFCELGANLSPSLALMTSSSDLPYDDNLMDSTQAASSTVRKLWQVLTPDQRRAAMVLFGLSLVGMILETLGVGLVIPAIAVMTQGDVATRYPKFAPVLLSLGNPTSEQLVISGMLILVVIYAVKALFLAFLAWRQTRFVYRVQADLSQRLFAGYLGQPYVFHMRRNSAELIRNVLNETNIFAQTVLMAGLGFLVELLVLLGISLLMLAVEPLGALLVVSTLGVASWGFNRVTQHHLSHWGVKRQLHEGRRIQHLQQGLGGAKDVKLLGREDEFLSEFRRHNEGFTQVGARYATIGQLPRLWLELLAVTGLAALVLVVLWQGHPLEALVPTLGLFAVGAFRLLPSVNRLISTMQSVRYGLPAIAVLHSELALLRDTHAPERGRLLPFRDSLKLEQVVFQYPSTEADTIRGITLQIARGTSVGFIGSTGTGKTTLVDIILGLLTPNSGRVLVDGIDIRGHERGWQDQIGYVPQSIFLTDDSLRRNIAFGLPNEQIDDDAIWRAVRAAQLETFVNESPAGIETMVGERGVRLSGGQRQRIGIARALYNDPSVLVLDEATSALDSVTEREFMETINTLRGTKTVIIIAHRLSTVEHCDRLFRLDQGRVVEEGEAAAVLGTLDDSSALSHRIPVSGHAMKSSQS